jgi:hypothetical protein
MTILAIALVLLYVFETYQRVHQRKEDLKDMEEFRARLMQNDRK